MDINLWKVFASLGVPGLALGVFYILLRSFKWRFPAVPKVWVGPIIVLFMLLVGSVTFYALTLWAPKDNTTGNTENPKIEEPIADELTINRLVSSLSECSNQTKENKVVVIDLIYQFKNTFFQTGWVYDSLSPTLIPSGSDYPIRPSQTLIDSGYFAARFCLETLDIKSEIVKISLGSKEFSRRITITWKSKDDKTYGTTDPIILISQPDPDWVIAKSAKWLTNSNDCQTTTRNTQQRQLEMPKKFRLPHKKSYLTGAGCSEFN
jgi:hypothetical protein